MPGDRRVRAWVTRPGPLTKRTVTGLAKSLTVSMIVGAKSLLDGIDDVDIGC